jgi:hypothetical protein
MKTQNIDVDVLKQGTSITVNVKMHLHASHLNLHAIFLALIHVSVYKYLFAKT